MAIKGVATISVDQLSATIKEYLDGFGDEADYALEKAARTAAEDAVQTLKATSPVFSATTYNRTNRKGTKRRRPGKYAKGWRAKTEGYANHLYIIHNATDYQLTHLLEKGHALRQGGRSKAIVHIKPVEQQAIKDFEAYIEEFLV